MPYYKATGEVLEMDFIVLSYSQMMKTRLELNSFFDRQHEDIDLQSIYRELGSLHYVVVANSTCLTQSERGPRNLSWQGTRSTPVIGLEHHTVPCTRDSAHKTFGPTDLTNTYLEGIWGIELRPSGLESDALTTRLPTALGI
ncbi:hypothetical protein TNCV_1477351 [Trichonephila clavipes]|nr:hypothetical protein TNCV_1477351 [Trichonephila clavipes]